MKHGLKELKTGSSQNQAIFYIILSAFFFAGMSFFVRLAGDLPVYQKAFFRNFIAAIIAFPVFLKGKHDIHIGKKNAAILFGRVFCGAAGMLCNFYAIDHMNLADANMLNKLSPFFAIIASVFILKEMAKKDDWLVLLIAFAGALLIMKPSLSSDFAVALIAVAGAALAGTAYTLVRKLSKNGLPGPMIVLAFSLFTCLTTLPASLLFGSPMTMKQFLILIMAGCFAAAAQFSITAAYSRGEARKISLFEYTQILFAAMFGFFFLGQVPDRLSILGYFIIIMSSFLKQRMNNRE